MKKLALVIILGLIITSCGSIKKNYVIVDAAYLPTPKWVKNGSYKTSQKSEYKYFVSTAENINKRLCEKTASARGNATIAGEIATTTNNTYKNMVKSEDGETTEISSEKLEQNIAMYLAGVENEETYWEKRLYPKSLGAKEDSEKYRCYILLKMNKSIYDKALNLSIEKTMKSISADEKNGEEEGKVKLQLINNNK
ncbi:MAG: hypothetical protein LBS34_01695 [Rickettsiales bacterium]|nr:hypothetical protein [Rickettsiales bacterium]